MDFPFIVSSTMKKTIAFVLAFAMTFATAFSAIGAKTTASAAPAANFSVGLNTDGTFAVTGANHQVQVGLATVKNGTAKIITNWDTYDVDDGSVSGRITFNPKKDAYYAFRTVSGNAFADPMFYKVIKHSDKYKATVTPSGDAYKVSFSGAADGLKAICPEGADVEALENNGQKTGEYLVTGTILQTGGVIQFAPKGNTKTAISEKVKYNGVDCVVSGNAVKANAKTVNVKIKKRANGPKVAINYAKGIATIPANCYYRYISSDASTAWEGGWKKVSTKTPVDLTKDSNVVVQVYKDATTKAAASKIGTGEFTRNVLDLASADALDYDNDDLVKKGLKITNKSSKTALQYVVSAIEPTTATKWKTLKAGGTATIKKPMTGGKLYFRAGAVAKELKGPGETFSITYEKKELTPTATNTGNKATVTFAENISGVITVASGNATIGTTTINEASATNSADVTLSPTPTAGTELTVSVELTGKSKKLYSIKDFKFKTK